MKIIEPTVKARRSAGRYRSVLIIACLVFSTLARADDNEGLRRGGDPHQVSISGLSSGAAMALQYGVAHSSSVIGVGSVAGPSWACAEGDLARAMQVCLKGQGRPQPRTEFARQLAGAGKIDSLPGNLTSALKQSFVFQSPEDEIVNPRSGQADVDFLTALTGVAPKFDQGHAADGSERAGHGILSPDGTDSCTGTGKTFIRRCGLEDNPAEVLSTIYGEGVPDFTKRKAVADADLWEFDQQPLIDAVKSEGMAVADDYVSFRPSQSAERQNFDLAATGYIFVPTAVCGNGKPPCRVHAGIE